MGEYTNKKVAEITGLTPINVNFYTREGVVEPVSGGGKRGQTWKYSERNLREFALIERLASYGITISVIKKFMWDFGNKYSFIDRYYVRMVHSESKERVDPWLVFHPDKSKDDYTAVYLSGGKKKVFSEMDKHGLDDALIINLGRLFDRIELP